MPWGLHVSELSILNITRKINRGLGLSEGKCNVPASDSEPLLHRQMRERINGRGKWKEETQMIQGAEDAEDQKFQLAPFRLPWRLARNQESFTSWLLPRLNFCSSCHQR